MTPATASLLALLAAIVLSMTTRINVGLVGLVLAWVVGVLVAGRSADAVMSGFPVSLFLTLTGVTLLFAAAEANGTLQRLAERVLSLARGRAAVLPWLLFAASFVMSASGPGAVSSVALTAPLAMAIGARVGLSPFLTALMIANGANAGNLSPTSAVGVIANTRMAAAGVVGHEWTVMLANALASVLVACAAYVWLRPRHSPAGAGATPAVADAGSFDRRHVATVIVLVAWIAAVLVLRAPLGPSALAAAVLLIVGRAADEAESIRRVPWGVVLMVCGMTTLVALLEATGGMALFTSLIAALATPATINGVVAGVTGAISTYSSTSGVVLPAFLPTVPGLVRELGGGDPLAISLSINIGSSLVDVSPLSTIGALCVAAVPDGPAARTLFRQLMAWGLSMILVGALLCQAGAGLFASFAGR